MTRRQLAVGAVATSVLAIAGVLAQGGDDVLIAVVGALFASDDDLPDAPTARLPDDATREELGALRLIELVSVARTGARFTRLDPAARIALLRSLAASDRAGDRLLVRLLKSVCARAYWGQPTTWAAIGYAP